MWRLNPVDCMQGKCSIHGDISSALHTIFMCLLIQTHSYDILTHSHNHIYTLTHFHNAHTTHILTYILPYTHTYPHIFTHSQILTHIYTLIMLTYIFSVTHTITLSHTFHSHNNLTHLRYPHTCTFMYTYLHIQTHIHTHFHNSRSHMHNSDLWGQKALGCWVLSLALWGV